MPTKQACYRLSPFHGSIPELRTLLNAYVRNWSATVYYSDGSKERIDSKTRFIDEPFDSIQVCYDPDNSAGVMLNMVFT
jgi:hypothetical protein